MKDWIVEYKEYWFDCDVEYEEQTVNVKAENHDEAQKAGKQIIVEMDSNDNKHNDVMRPMVRRTIYRCVEESRHIFNSSVKEPALNGVQGHVDTPKWNYL